MILDPAIIALLLGSFLVTFLLLLSVSYAVRILRSWDISSGSELQLNLERKTYLISTLVSYAFFFQLLSLFLFVYTSDRLCTLFVGAMCAVGTLGVNSFGYPALIMKLIDFLLAGTWLILNYTDNRAYDYPLTKKKYALLVFVTPCILAETVLQILYFAGLKPNVITSCCGSLFSTETAGIASGLASLPVLPMEIAFYSGLGVLLVSGGYFYRKVDGSGYVFSVLSTATFVISVAALISFISLYFYELPTHHCPFCILHAEYGYVGYVLYVLLLAGVLSGLGIGALTPFREKPSLRKIVPSLLRGMALVSMISYSAFALIATFRMMVSNLRLGGY